MDPSRLRWLLVPAAACAALAGFYLAHELDRRAPELASGTWLPQPKPVADFRLTDNLGQPYTRADLAGAPTLVYFGFTRCPDVCPATLIELARIRRQAAIGDLRVLFVTVDPERDTPPVLGLYVHAFDPSFRGVTGAPAEIRQVAANFGVAVNRVALPGGDYTMDHSAVVFLVNTAARIVAIFTPPFDAGAFAADLRRAAPYLRPRRFWQRG
ncbi:MAG TPA: SCO family protein [Steroidobacteraceae bacterium]|nr:SCO family protein [Steroidobacteraceae bacterium]